MKLAFSARAAFAAATIVTAACAPPQDTPATVQAGDIIRVAAGNGQFNTLVAAVKAAGLVETLQGPGPFTVFAPTDAAFARLPAGTIEALLADKEKLASILTYHVVSGKVTSSDIARMGGATPATVNGASVTVTLRDGQVYVDAARVVTPDVQASNGVIHVIDAVILPGAITAGAGK